MTARLTVRTCVEAMELIVEDPQNNVVTNEVHFPLLTPSRRAWIELQLQNPYWHSELSKGKS